MSSEDISIRVDKLSKRYEIYARPADRLKQMVFPRLRRSMNMAERAYFNEFWALRDVSFEVRRGETIGIVGRNGSGKSTLLQIICGILTQTHGEVQVNGRIAALLELGAGFNPEFTGRENVRLTGLLYGLSESELFERYDAILEFSEIGAFIDQPVKTYSSGMYVRLAFAIAINVSPEILVVDEALAVGDESFQRKCFARINRIRDDGATILFVSHSAGAVTQLCDRAVLLDAGELLAEGSPKFVVSRYHKMLYAPPDRVDEIRKLIATEENTSESDPDDLPSAELSEIDKADALAAKASGQHSEQKPDSRGWHDEGMVPKSTVRYETRGARIEAPRIETPGGQRVNVLHAGDEYVYTYRVDFSVTAVGVRCGMLIKTLTGLELGGGVTSLPHTSIDCVQAGQSVMVRFRFRCLLAQGVYFFNAGALARIGEDETYVDRLIDACMFRVLPQPERLATGFVDFYVSSETPEIISSIRGKA